MSIWKAVSVAGVLVIPLAFGAPAVADNKTVILEDDSFNPREVNVSPGDTVTWRHRDDDRAHSVTFEDGYDPYQGCSEPDILESCMEEGDSTQRTFLLAGTFRYYCRIHQKDGMTGVVNVLGPSSAPGGATTSTTRVTGGSGSSSSSSSSTTATTELVVSTSTTRAALVANIPTTTATMGRAAFAPAPRASAPALNPEARDNEEQLAALPTPETGGDGETAAGTTGGGDSGTGSLGLVGGLAVAVAGAAGVLAWKFRPRGRIA